MFYWKDVDIVERLRVILNTNTEHYKCDFEKDLKNIEETAKSKERPPLIWLCRENGTWMLPFEEIFQRGTFAYTCFQHYVTMDRIFAYLLCDLRLESGKIIGDLYTLDYPNYAFYVLRIGEQAEAKEQLRLLQEKAKHGNFRKHLQAIRIQCGKRRVVPCNANTGN